MSSDARRKLDEIEPFDEWEEFSLFANHYSLVIATNRHEEQAVAKDSRIGLQSLSARASYSTSNRASRRFGTPMNIENEMGQQFVVNLFGLGVNNRPRSFDVYHRGEQQADFDTHYEGPISRMCHSLVNVGSYGVFLTGGRSSPASALSDCWLLRPYSHSWERVHELPFPLYRHATVRLGNSALVLLIGGKQSPKAVFNGCLVYHPRLGWLKLRMPESSLKPKVFGAIAACFPEDAIALAMEEPSSSGDGSYEFQGLLAGGMYEDGMISNETLYWTLRWAEGGAPTIEFSYLKPQTAQNTDPQDIVPVQPTQLLSRFGAICLNRGGHLLVIGGIIDNGLLSKDNEILVLNASATGYRVVGSVPLVDACEKGAPRPLLIGISAITTKERAVLIMGGGATCFSMGTFWNKGCYTFDYSLSAVPPEPLLLKRTWLYRITVEFVQQKVLQAAQIPKTRQEQVAVTTIPRIRLGSEVNFEQILQSSQPVIIEGLALGECVAEWTPKYLVEAIGPDRKVGKKALAISLSQALTYYRSWFMNPEHLIWILPPKISLT